MSVVLIGKIFFIEYVMDLKSFGIVFLLVLMEVVLVNFLVLGWIGVI